MKKKRCFILDSLAFSIALDQTGRDSFTVTYGKQIDKRLTYEKAALMLGTSIMHALACDGKLDNTDE